MKRLLLLALAGVLSSCLIIAPEPAPNPDPVTPLRVLEANYKTDVSVDGQPAICDDRTTTLSYTFRYEGELESWTSYLRGVTLGQVKGERIFTPGEAGVNPYVENGYEVTYTMGPHVAPYTTGKPQPTDRDIVVVPVPQPQIIGASKLHLILKGENGDAQPYVSADIPVVSNCP